MVKSETSFYSLLRLGLKGVKIFWNVVKVCMYTCLSNGNPNLWSNFNSKKLLKVKLCHVVSLQLGLKGVKIAWNVVKASVHAYLSNGYQNIWSRFNFENLVKSETPLCGFVRVLLKGAENCSEHHESRRALLSSKCTSKSMMKF